MWYFQLLQQFKPSNPWIQKIKPKKACQMCPQVFNESLLERNLFHDFLKARFARRYSYVVFFFLIYANNHHEPLFSKQLSLLSVTRKHYTENEFYSMNLIY
jgi:hypothetical protein